MKGKLIVLEGIDGSGKETQAKLLRTYIQELRYPVKKISFPNYNSDSSALVKMYLKGELGNTADDVNAYAASSFYAVDRYADYVQHWKALYESGYIIVADRYTTSNAIHQCSKLQREEWDNYLNWLFDYEYKLLEIPKPDLIIYLHLDLSVCQELINKRCESDDGKKDIHETDSGYLSRSQEAADYCSKKFEWKKIECCRNGILRNIEDIHKDILECIVQKH